MDRLGFVVDFGWSRTPVIAARRTNPSGDLSLSESRMRWN